MKKKWLLCCISILMLMVLVNVGCNDDDNPTGSDGDQLAAIYVGTWVFQSANVNGETATLATVMEWAEGATSARMIFEANGNYVYQEHDTNDLLLSQESGTLAIDDGDFTLTATLDGDGPINPPDVTTGTVSLSGSTMSLIILEEGNTVVFSLEKE